MRSAFRRVPSAVAVVMAGALAACSSDATSTDPSPSPSPALATASTGNGAPSGAHYNLNIIAVPHAKTGDLTGGGNVIFVGLGTKTAAVTTKILLEQSANAGVFAVLDKDGTDGEAKFSLPAPGGYTVWARALGKPYGRGDAHDLRYRRHRRARRRRHLLGAVRSVRPRDRKEQLPERHEQPDEHQPGPGAGRGCGGRLRRDDGGPV